MPVQTEADVSALFEKALSLTRVSGFFTRDRYRADIEDHFFYVGAICPQHFRPLQEEVVNLTSEQLTFLRFSFHTWLYLLQDAPDRCVERLMQRLAHAEQEDYLLEEMLPAIGTPAALAAVAEYAERTHKQKIFHDMGFWLPGNGKSAEPRFTRQRKAVRFQSVDDALPVGELARRPHPVGLPISLFAQEAAQDLIVWHYLTLDLTEIDGLPHTSFSRVHLVSPPRMYPWMLFCTISPENGYTDASVYTFEEEDPDEKEFLLKLADEGQLEGRGELVLLPYDEKLVYRNGHTQLTDGVSGDVGGAPLGLYENPCCPICGKLMFHICTVSSNLREYGDGLRSVFVCEDCMQVASHAVGWN